LREFKNTDIAEWKRRARKSCHAYIRARDKYKPCISCGYIFTATGRQLHAGHYYPDGNHSAIRYDEDNIHGQCSICNNFKSGSLKTYRTGLIDRIGEERVERLDNLAKSVKKWSIEDLKNVVQYYNAKKKELNG